MIDFSFKIINDSFRDSNLNFFKDLENLEKTLSLTKEQKDQALREYLKQENPYYCNSIKAISFCRDPNEILWLRIDTRCISIRDCIGLK